MDVAKIMSVHEHIIALSNICNLEFLLLSIPNYNREIRIMIGTIKKICAYDGKFEIISYIVVRFGF